MYAIHRGQRSPHLWFHTVMKGVSHNEDASAMNFGIPIHSKQRSDVKEQKILMKEHSVRALCAGEESESVSVQERKISKTCNTTDLSAHKSIPVCGIFGLQFLNPFCSGDPILMLTNGW